MQECNNIKIIIINDSTVRDDGGLFKFRLYSPMDKRILANGSEEIN